MKPNGYQHRSIEPIACERCGKEKRSSGLVSYYMLYEANGDKVCRECGKELKII